MADRQKPEWFEIADNDRIIRSVKTKKPILRTVLAFVVSGAVIGGGMHLVNADAKTPAVAHAVQTPNTTTSPSLQAPTKTTGLSDPQVQNLGDDQDFGDDHEFGEGHHRDGDREFGERHHREDDDD